MIAETNVILHFVKSIQRLKGQDCRFAMKNV